MYYLLENVIILNYKGDLRRVYSLLQSGHRLEKCLITTMGGISFLDCVKECLRTTGCLSVNYFQPAHFYEVKIESKDTVFKLYLAKLDRSTANKMPGIGSPHYCIVVIFILTNQIVTSVQLSSGFSRLSNNTRTQKTHYLIG